MYYFLAPAARRARIYAAENSLTVKLKAQYRFVIENMATVRLTGDASGYTELSAPNAAGNNKLVLPTGNGVDEQYLQTNGSGTLTWSDPFRLKQGTAVASTSGTSIDFTGIPSWVKRVTVMFDGVSTNGSAVIRIQIGDAGGIETSGYTGASSYAGTSNTTGAGTYSSGFDSFGDTNASVVRYGCLYLSNLNGNTWALSGIYSVTTPSVYTMQFAGIKTLSDTLTQLRITTGAADTFDAGTINIMYEG